MKFKVIAMNGTVVSALAGAALFAASALAQTQIPANAPPSTAEPGSEMQPYGVTQPNTTTPPNPQPTDSTQSSAPQSSSATPQQSSSTTTSASAVPLNSVKDAKTTLASASVQDSSGQQVGQVATVHTSKRGTPTTVDVTLQSTGGGRARTVAIKASQLRFDQTSNTLKTDLTSSELQSLPAATGT